MEEKSYKEEINKALIKKAKGYKSQEVVEEFVVEENDTKLVKRKVTTKDVPPDISAAKVVLETVLKNTTLAELSDEEIDKEIKKISKLLKDLGEIKDETN